jgi:benzoate/toluate 1,2-dioxygenase reductase component
MTIPSSANSLTSPFTAELLRRSWLSGKTFELELRRPATFQFRPGQRIRLFHEGVERDYSLLSRPDSPRLGLCVRHLSTGLCSSILAAAEIGTSFTFTGPHGYFIFQRSSRPPVFVATGTGVAPFLSMTRSGVVGFTMLHGVRTADELYYRSDFGAAASLYVPCLSHASPESALPPGAYCGRVTEYLRGHLPPGAYDFYLCGRREMIRDVTLLVDERFPESLVYAEIFY